MESLQYKESRKQIFFHLLKKLETLREFDMKQKDIVMDKIIAICILFKHLICRLQCIEKGDLKLLLCRLEGFYVWPKKCSIVVSELTKLIEAECCFKGVGFLKHFAEVSSSPTIVHSFQSKILKTKPLFYIKTGKPVRSFIVNSVLSASPFREKDIADISFKRGLSTKTYTLILLCFIDSIVGLTQKDISNVFWLKKEEVFQFLVKITNMSFDSINAKVKDSKDIIDKFYALKQEIYISALDNITNPNQDLDPLRFLEKYPLNYIPVFPPFSHLSLEGPKQTSEDNESKTTEKDDKNKFDMHKAVHSLLKAYSKIKSDKEVILRIVLSGGDNLISQFISKYELIAKESYAKNIKLRFYLVPSVKSILSSYISRNDSIYRKSVLEPFERRLMLPFFDEEDSPYEYDEFDSQFVLPSLYLRKVVENYVTLAEYEVGIHLFKAQAWNTDDFYNIKPNETFLFYDRVVILPGPTLKDSVINLEVEDFVNKCIIKKKLSMTDIKELFFFGLQPDKKSVPYLTMQLANVNGKKEEVHRIVSCDIKLSNDSLVSYNQKNVKGFKKVLLSSVRKSQIDSENSVKFSLMNFVQINE